MNKLLDRIVKEDLLEKVKTSLASKNGVVMDEDERCHIKFLKTVESRITNELAEGTNT